MTGTPNLPDWLTIDAPAVILQTPILHTPSITKVTVKTIAAKSLSTTDTRGNVQRWTYPRYGDFRLSRSLGTWGGNAELLPPDHPDVLAAANKITAANQKTRALQAFDLWTRTPANQGLTDRVLDSVRAAHAAAAAVTR